MSYREVGHIARELIRLARKTPPEHFQDLALECVHTFIPFDSALWATGTMHGDEPRTHAVHLYHLPPQIMQDYQLIQSQDILLARLIDTRTHNQTWDIYDIIDRESFVQTPFYTSYCKPYGLEQLLSTSHYDDTTSLYSIISLYRSAPQQPFSQIQKVLKNVLVPLLVETRNLNLFLDLQHDDKIPMHHAIAICDSQSLIMEAEPAFAPLIRSQWPDWQGPLLPFDATLLHQPRRFGAIVLWAEKKHELLHIHVRQTNSIDRLTPCQQTIVSLVAQGLSNKAIAIQADLSPKTVGNHLHNIYRQLGISNRHQLISLYKRESTASPAVEDTRAHCP